MPDRWYFQLPTRIQFGRGGLRKLGQVAREFGRCVLLVGYRDRHVLEAAYGRAAASLGGADMTVLEFREVPPDPTAELAIEAARAASGAGVDVICALGGGSVIDAAKAAALLAKTGGSPWDYADANPNCRPVAGALPVIAVPTTAGTGAEVTPVAVLTCQGVGSRPEFPLKASISGTALYPKVALVDPDLALGSPPRLTAAAGADALAHAVESCISRRANPLSTALAEKALGLIARHLPRAVEVPDDPAARGPLALAATLAGAALGNAGVTMAHSIAHALGAMLHIPHGEAAAAATPLGLEYNKEACIEVYSRLAGCCGIAADSPDRSAHRFVEFVTEFLLSLGLPSRVEVPAGVPGDLPARLARNAFLSTAIPLKLNPRKIDEAVLAGLLERIV